MPADQSGEYLLFPRPTKAVFQRKDEMHRRVIREESRIEILQVRNQIGVLLAFVTAPADGATFTAMNHGKMPFQLLFLQIVGKSQRWFGLHICYEAAEFAQP